jgi:PAS domain S-box-containing protein
MDERTPQRVESEFTFADGTSAWYEARAEPVPEGIFVLSQDITERKRAEEKLRKNEERLRLALQAAAAGTWEWDLRTQKNVWSEETWRLYGLEPDCEPSYETWRRAIHPDDREHVERAVQEAARQGAELNTEWRVNDSQSTERWLMSRGKPARDGVGRVVSYTGIVVDITERKEMERDRERHLAQVREANEAKDLFFNTLSHELRTPLAAMVNAIEVLKKPDVARNQRTRAFGILERNIRHQTRLIEDLLDLSRIMRKKVEIDREPLDLREVVGAQVEAIEPAAQQAHLSLRIEAPVEPVPIVGDIVRLGQVVSNLLSNAVKFTAPGGWIKVRVAPEHGEAAVRVADNGIGIAPEVLPQIFEPFRQAETSKTRVKGLGIGLAVARSLAELHGGTLEARSGGLGHGSELIFRLPLQTARAAQEVPVPAKQAVRQGRRVLVIEDNADLRDSLLILLEMLGHTVMAASDGSAGVTLARRERPEVALIDIGLPDMDGYAVARVLRSDPTLGDTRLIALSGYVTPEHRERALAAGFDRHLPKPVDVDELQRVLAGS